MGKVIEISGVLWKELSAAAWREGRTPSGVVHRLMRDFLEVERDLALDAAIGKEVQWSGYREQDAVRLVREYRSQGVNRRAGRIREPSGRYRRPRRASVAIRRRRVAVVLGTNVLAAPRLNALAVRQDV